MSTAPPATSTRSLFGYVCLAYAISWTLWAPAVMARLGWIDPVPVRRLHLAGGLGPLLAATALTALGGGRPALARLWKSCLAGRHWLLVAVLIPTGLFLVATAALSAVSGASIDWTGVGTSAEFRDVSRPVYWLSSVVFYGFGEEVGWRGFALPRLQARRSALNASLLVALAWAGWHLPLFVFSPGLSSMGVGGSVGWLLSLGLGSVLLTWLFNSSGGSVGAVALFHATLDIFMMSPVSAALPTAMGALLTVGALALIPLFGREHLSRRPRVSEPPRS